MSNAQDLTFDWSGSLNNSVQALIPGGLEVVYSYNSVIEDDGGATGKVSIFEAQAYSLYTALTSGSSVVGDNWLPVSCSYYDHGAADSVDRIYKVGVGAGWDSVKAVRFPEYQIPVADINYTGSQTTEVFRTSNSYNVVDSITGDSYTPQPHPWVLLSKAYSAIPLESDSDYNPADPTAPVTRNLYLTIDCRYPTPPHLTNTETEVYTQNTIGGPKYSLIGAANTAGITYSSLYGADGEKTVRNLGEEVTLNLKATFDTYRGIAVKHPADISTPFTNPFYEGGATPTALYTEKCGVGGSDPTNIICSATTTKIYEKDFTVALDETHDYISRAVAFFDIVVAKSGPLLTAAGTDYGTNNVRPYFEKKIINTLGFDYIEEGETFTSSIGNLADYKWHYNWVSGRADFSFALSKNSSTTPSKTLNSFYGLFSVKNRSQGDDFEHVTVALNTEPGDYSGSPAAGKYYAGNSINKNGFGNTVELVNVQDHEEPISNTVNNYFNTCFRNYNCKENLSSPSSLRYGKISDTNYYTFRDSLPQNLPAFAPTKPGHAAVSGPELGPVKGYNGKVALVTLPRSSIVQESQVIQETSGCLPEKKYTWNFQPVKKFTLDPSSFSAAGSAYRTLSASFNPANQFGISTASIDAWPDAIEINKKSSSTLATKPSQQLVQISFADIENQIRTYEGDDTIKLFQVYTRDTRFTPGDLSQQEYSWDPERKFTGSTLTINRSTNATRVVSWIRDYLFTEFDYNNGAFDVNGTVVQATIQSGKAGSVPVPKMISAEHQEGLNLTAPDSRSTATSDQSVGVNAFSAFKTLYSDGGVELPLIGLNYGFFNPLYSSTDMYGALDSDPVIESQMMSDTTTGNIFNNSYTELPIYLASTKRTAPFIKGSVTDLYWVPANIEVKFITPGDPCAPSSPGITKMLWKGWSMPWIGAELE